MNFKVLKIKRILRFTLKSRVNLVLSLLARNLELDKRNYSALLIISLESNVKASEETYNVKLNQFCCSCSRQLVRQSFRLCVKENNSLIQRNEKRLMSVEWNATK